jgi:hypothetical protein
MMVRRSVGLRGLKLNPALLTYLARDPPARKTRRVGLRLERRVSKRLDAATIDRVVAEYTSKVCHRKTLRTG